MTTEPGPSTVELVYDDGEPMESAWHREQMELLIQLALRHWNGRPDCYAGGNMFIYYSPDQARARQFRGPDFFAITGVDGRKIRKSWVMWEEGGRLPDVIVELLSDTTRDEDLGSKKDLYERVWRTSEYFCVDPENGSLRGWRLLANRYEPLLPGEGGRLESRVLGVTIGLKTGAGPTGSPGTWTRFWTPTGELVPSLREEVEAERARAATAQRRADVESGRVTLTLDAGRILAVFLTRGVEVASAEIRRRPGPERAQLLEGLAEMDAGVAAALRRHLAPGR